MVSSILYHIHSADGSGDNEEESTLEIDEAMSGSSDLLSEGFLQDNLDEWVTGRWGQCNTTCGLGFSERYVICPSNNCNNSNRNGLEMLESQKCCLSRRIVKIQLGRKNYINIFFTFSLVTELWEQKTNSNTPLFRYRIPSGH